MIESKIVKPTNPTEFRGYMQAMKDRCTIQGHEWENGLTASFQFIDICKWCDAKVVKTGGIFNSSTPL